MADFSPTLVDFSPMLSKYSSPLGFILRSSENPSTEEKYDRKREIHPSFSATVVISHVGAMSILTTTGQGCYGGILRGSRYVTCYTGAYPGWEVPPGHTRPNGTN